MRPRRDSGYSAAGPDEATVLGALEKVGARTYSLGQPRVYEEGTGPVTGKKNTFAFGFKGLADAPPAGNPEARNYVAIGDSTTAGHSVQDCRLADEKKYYVYGCPKEPVPFGDPNYPDGAPYPDLLQSMLGPPYSDGYRTADEGDYKTAYEVQISERPGVSALVPDYERSTLGPQNGHFNRVGVFGYTITEALADYKEAKNNLYGGDRRYARGDVQIPTPWESQLHAVEDAQELVTVSLGANDMNFSAYDEWIREEFNGTTQENADYYIRRLRGQGEFGGGGDKLVALFDALDKVSNRGVKVVVNKYYNGVHAPWFDGGGAPGAGPQPTEPPPISPPSALPPPEIPATPNCQTFHSTAETITNTINAELEEVRSASANGGEMELTDLPVKWVEAGLGDHGMGGPYPAESWVFGSKCNIDGALRSAEPDSDNGRDDYMQEIGEDYDPHPNLAGSTAMAEEMKKVIENE